MEFSNFTLYWTERLKKFTLMVMPFGFSVRRLMRLLRKSLALITPPGLAGPAMSGVVVAGLGVLSV